MVVTLGQHGNVGEKPTVILYTYIHRHAGLSNKTTFKKTMEHIIINLKGSIINSLVYDNNNAIEPYNNRGLCRGETHRSSLQLR